MRKRIAIVCALLAGRNTGMFTVDRAAFEYFAQFLSISEVTFYVLGDPACAGFKPDELGFSYVSLKDHAEDFFASDLIIYWGDFVHARSYWEADLLIWLVNQGLADHKGAAADLVYRLLMLENASDEVLRRVVIFGGTIMTNTASQLTDKRYRRALDRLLTLAAGVFFRDSVSSAYAAQLRGEQATQGSDCALLLSDPSGVANRRGEIGVFFGRANWIAQALAFAHLLGWRSKLSSRWLPWFPSPKRHLLVARGLGFAASTSHQPAMAILNRVKSFDAVISDTYHLCVNSWRLGVPAICIGRGAERNNTTLGDKKKESFYAMLGASDYYVYREEVMSSLGFCSLSRAASAIQDRPAIEIVFENLRRQADTARCRLSSACMNVLAR